MKVVFVKTRNNDLTLAQTNSPFFDSSGHLLFVIILSNFYTALLIKLSDSHTVDQNKKFHRKRELCVFFIFTSTMFLLYFVP